MKVSSPSFFLSAIETFRRTRIISKERSFIFNSFRYVDNCRIIVHRASLSCRVSLSSRLLGGSFSSTFLPRNSEGVKKSRLLFEVPA